MNTLVEFPAARIRSDKKFLLWHSPLTTHEEFARRRHIHDLAGGHLRRGGRRGATILYVRMKATDHQVSDWGGPHNWYMNPLKEETGTECLSSKLDDFFKSLFANIADMFSTDKTAGKFATGGVMAPSTKSQVLGADGPEQIMRRDPEQRYVQGDQLEHATYGWPCVVIGYGWPAPGEYLVEATMQDGRVFSLPVRPGLLRKRKPRQAEQSPDF
jgi:hypothetical protein